MKITLTAKEIRQALLEYVNRRLAPGTCVKTVNVYGKDHVCITTEGQ